MGRFNAKDVDNYGGNGGGGYFSLKNDGDVARVRFMYESVDDVAGYAVHEVEIDGKKRYVNCIRDYNEPLDECPFCAARKFQTAKLFIPIYNIDEERVQTWERGKKFFSKMSSICARYPDVVSHVFEIERNGRPGDTSTTYEIYEVDRDDTKLEDLPELPNIMGGIVLDKTAEEMEYYLDNGVFPADESEQPVRRRGERTDRPEREERRETSRRTPASSRRGRDRF